MPTACLLTVYASLYKVRSKFIKFEHVQRMRPGPCADDGGFGLGPCTGTHLWTEWLTDRHDWKHCLFRNFVGGGNYLLLINPYTDTFHTVSQFCLLASTGDPPPNILQEAQIRVLELADCQERYSSTPFQVYNESICVFKLNDDDDHTGSCYVSIQTLAMCRPPTVTARNKQEKKPGLMYVILKRIVPINGY